MLPFGGELRRSKTEKAGNSRGGTNTICFKFGRRRMVVFVKSAVYKILRVLAHGAW